MRPAVGKISSAITLSVTSTLLAGLLAATATVSRAADFSVSPMSLQFSQGSRSGEIQVRNLDQQAIRFEVRGVDWSQDGNGKNIYVDSQSLIWFPRAMELAAGESRIIRVGVKAPPASQEKSYIIVLKEVVAEEVKPQSQRGARVRLLLSVSVPVFIPPAKPQFGGSLEAMGLRAGTLNFVIANTGNQHFSYRETAVIGLASDGTEKFRHKVPRSTLLAGSRQRFEVRIPQEICKQMSEMALTLVSQEQTEIKRRLDVSRADCE